MSTARSTPLGHSIVTEGLEVPVEELDYEDEKLKRYNMVWTNPQTGEKCKHSSLLLRRLLSVANALSKRTALQIHGQAAWKLYLKDAPDAEERVIDDLAEVRAFMDGLMRHVIRPENIYAHHHSPGDVALWYNRALWHSVVSSARL